MLIKLGALDISITSPRERKRLKAYVENLKQEANSYESRLDQLVKPYYKERL